MLKDFYDIVIIGGGPAGLTAAIYGARGGADCIVFEKMTTGGKAAITPVIENYPAFKKIDGYELGMKFHEHAEYYGAEVVYDEVTGLELDGEFKTITTANGSIKASAVIIATGASPKTLGLSNERQFTGRGISYCATCDGNFYRNKTVAVNGGGNTAVEDALYMAEIAAKVYLIHRRKEFRAEKIMTDKLANHKNIELILDSVITGIGGSEKLDNITVENTVTGENRKIDIDGLFVAIGGNPNNSLFKDKLELDAAGYIITDKHQKTNKENIYAAGDITDTQMRQIVTAAADGARAAAEAIKNIR